MDISRNKKKGGAFKSNKMEITPSQMRYWTHIIILGVCNPNLILSTAEILNIQEFGLQNDPHADSADENTRLHAR